MMSKQCGILSCIREAIAFIERMQLQAEEIRLSLNHEIMFNLRDTYLAVARQQPALSLPTLASFLNLSESNPALQRMVRWNNHGSSLNLSFAEFSAMLVSKQDRLLGKMVLQRQEMGAIPNFLLDEVREILLKQVELHEYCIGCGIQEETLREWVETVIDENGDVCQELLDEFMGLQSNSSRSASSFASPFMRFLQTSGNITGERLLALWRPSHQPTLLHDASKLHKLSTYISVSPKSLLSCQSQQQLIIRPEFYDCLNRPPTGPPEIRQSKSIKKHIYRMSSDKNLHIMAKDQSLKRKQAKQSLRLMVTLKQIIQVQRQTENCRIQLRLCADFYPVLFYDSIPKERSSNAITPSTLRNYLESFGYYAPLQEVYLLFRRYSPNKMSFNSFCTMFDTVEREFDLLEKNRFVESLQDVDAGTKKQYFTLLVTIIRNEVKVNQIKMALIKQGKDLIRAVSCIFEYFGNVERQIAQQQLKEAFRYYLGASLPMTDIRLIFRRCTNNPQKQTPETITIQSLMKQLLPPPTRK